MTPTPTAMLVRPTDESHVYTQSSIFETEDDISVNSKSPIRKVVRGCPVPIVIAGGPKMATERDVFQMTVEAVKAGAIGVSIGRNVFQHRNPIAMTRALAKIVHEGATVERAMRELKR